jgi:hypothetical protein
LESEGSPLQDYASESEGQAAGNLVGSDEPQTVLGEHEVLNNNQLDAVVCKPEVRYLVIDQPAKLKLQSQQCFK